MTDNTGLDVHFNTADYKILQLVHPGDNRRFINTFDV